MPSQMTNIVCQVSLKSLHQVQTLRHVKYIYGKQTDGPRVLCHMLRSAVGIIFSKFELYQTIP